MEEIWLNLKEDRPPYGSSVVVGMRGMKRMAQGLP